MAHQAASSAPLRSRSHARDLLLGMATGEALGLPIAYSIREDLEIFPVKTMKGYGTFQQPPGTWGANSALAFCLAESLLEGTDLRKLGKRFIRWQDEAYWTAHGQTLEVKNAIKAALNNLRDDTLLPETVGGRRSVDNGNEGLARLIPLAFHVKALPVATRYHLVQRFSGMTHGHIRSVLSSFILLEVIRLLLEGKNKQEAYQLAASEVRHFVKSENLDPSELRIFDRILEGHLPKFARFQVHSSGYVIHTVEASLWSWLTTDSYELALITAINLGGDTHTIGAIVGALAGLSYGHSEIPLDWIRQLARREDILTLSDRLQELLGEDSEPRASGKVA